MRVRGNVIRVVIIDVTMPPTGRYTSIVSASSRQSRPGRRTFSFQEVRTAGVPAFPVGVDFRRSVIGGSVVDKVTN